MKRYMCNGCERTFNALTGTPLAHLQKREKWLEYARAIVDVSIAWGKIADADLDWWSQNNKELFVTIEGKLPGKLQILEENVPVTLKVRSAPVVHRDRNVICVLLPPKR